MMKKLASPLVVAVSLLFACDLARSQSSNVTFSVAATPPQGGTVTGGGTYAPGTKVTSQIQAAPGWYINAVSFTPSSLAATNYNEQYARLAIVASLEHTNADFTLITNDAETPTITANTSLAVTFGVLSPIFTQEPLDQTVLGGTDVTIGSGASGRLPISYQWQRSGTNIAGATNSYLALSNVQLADAGAYSVVASNAFGVTNSAPAILTVQDFIIYDTGEPVIGPTYVAAGRALIGFESLYPTGTIFYTLDGSAPDYTAAQYDQQDNLLIISNSCDLRAIAYSPDFSHSVLSDPLQITIVPTHVVNLVTTGGGNLSIDPYAFTYTNGTEVTITPNQPAFSSRTVIFRFRKHHHIELRSDSVAALRAATVVSANEIHGLVKETVSV